MDGILTDNSIMDASISKTHVAKELRQIPAHWFMWYKENVPRVGTNQNLFDYISENWLALQERAKKEKAEYFKNKK